MRVNFGIAAAAILMPLLVLGGEPARVSASPPSAKASAPIDLTGIWVSIVDEDWRWRMLTAPKGDYPGVPLNEAGQKVADSWDKSEEGSCKAFGIGGLMRMPTRVRIRWETENVLRIETDSGLQVRRLYFGAAPALTQRSLQGRSVAAWEHTLPLGDGWGLDLPVSPRPGGSLKVVTTDFVSGWLRRNGVPYSEDARITEYFDAFAGPDGSHWFVVTTIVDDSQYLSEPFITSSHFRREPTESEWHPRPCKA